MNNNKDLVELYYYQIELIKQLNLDIYTDEELAIYLQNRFNEKYGTKKRFFKTVPNVYASIHSVEIAKKMIENDRQRQLFWKEELGNSPEEIQWRRDIGYIQSRSSFDWSDSSSIRNCIWSKRKSDSEANMDVVIVTTTIKTYDYFKAKLDLEMSRSVYESSPNTIPSAPPLEYIVKN